MDERVTIKNVAEKSGVSLATVSLVINNKPGVAAETRAKVLAAADALGYAQKPASTAGKVAALNTLGLVVNSLGAAVYENPFYSRVVFGIEDACRRNGVTLVLTNLPGTVQNRPLETPAVLYNESVDGLLMVGAYVDESLFNINGKRAMPVVLVDAYSNQGTLDSVVSDNFRAAYQAVEYLIAKGHRYIGMAGGEPDCYPSLRERRNGYLRALKENGISETYIAYFNINATTGNEEIRKLLKENPQITAMFGVNDDTAINIMRVAQDMGLNVPRDLSVIGYDDTYAASIVTPALTTMHVDTIAMGKAAVHLLALRLDDQDTARMTLTIHPTLVERDSVAQR